MAESCPECSSPVTVADTVVVSEIVECPDCACELEVVARDPLMLAVAPEPEEDWGE